MFFRTGDPIEDFNRHDAELERRSRRLPRCTICGESIWQDTAVRIERAWYCDECLSDAREVIED